MTGQKYKPRSAGRAGAARSGVNINDLAERAGVAPATVSRALNGYADIAEATRERILKLAREMNYRPSSRARQLARGSIETVAFVLPAPHGPVYDPFLSDFLDALAAALADHDYDLLVATVRQGETETEVYRRLISAQKTAGFIITNSRDHDPRIKLLQDVGVPFVVYGRAKLDAPFASVDMDNEVALAGMVDHLVALGHRRIAYIDLDDSATFARLRRAGFDAGVARNKLPAEDIAIVSSAHDSAGGQSAVSALFDGTASHRPTAVVCPADVVAIGVIQAVTARGFVVGRDVSVTGYDGVPLGAFTSPPLTTMSQPTREIGKWLVETLFAMMAGKDPADFQTVLAPTLVRRESDGSPTLVTGPRASDVIG
ncbi:MAG: LacI family DNA-binding transcriptional regulator [Devosiaceae bacterium]|nr:LacI family DNA-binding transcriptional regulator [Devosiaceae bacterium MH13]